MALDRVEARMDKEFEYQILREKFEEAGTPGRQASSQTDALRSLKLQADVREAQLQGQIEVLRIQMAGLRKEVTAFGIALLILIAVVVATL